jgi:exopolyphosphatase/guanosine-5'-triphosphate,3'-diphosphate pyrophosphatase
MKKTIPLPADIKENNEPKIITRQADGLERRGVVDTGSGGTKVLIVDVDVKTNKIVGVIFEHYFPVAYQAALEKSSEGAFDASIQEQGLKTFHDIREIFDQHGVEKVSAIATEAFRKATNGNEFAATVESLTQIPLRVVS